MLGCGPGSQVELEEPDEDSELANPVLPDVDVPPDSLDESGPEDTPPALLARPVEAPPSPATQTRTQPPTAKSSETRSSTSHPGSFA